MTKILFDNSCAITGFFMLTIWLVNGNKDSTIDGCAENNKICKPYSQRACCDGNYSCKIKKSRNDFVCTEKVFLRGTCGNDEDCSDITHAKCSKDKECTCIVGYTRLNGSYCAPSLDSFCWKDEKCATEHASCIDKRCRCDFNYFNLDNECLEMIIGSACKRNSDCNGVKYAQCSAHHTCTCPMNTEPVNLVSCVPILNGYCYTNDDCKVKNSICVDKECKCKPQYKTFLNECKLPFIGMPCYNSRDCDEFIDHTICSENNECICKQTHLSISQSKCATAYNQICFESDSCATENSVCEDYRCQCKPGYIYRNQQCVSKYLGQWCKKEKDCSEVKFATCSNDNICVCQANYVESDLSTCLPLLDSSCSMDSKCFVQNSTCQNGKCECALGFVARSNNHCAKISLDHKCLADHDCFHIAHSHCSESGFCFCDSGYVSINGNKCAPILGQFCTKSKPCTIENADCIDNECQCKPYFVEHRDAECIPMRFHKRCEDNTDCTGIKNSVCFEEECVCNIHHAPVNSSACAMLLGGYCSTNEDCYPKNSVCSSNVCGCDLHYTVTTNYKCEPNILGTMCMTNADCDRVQNAVCSADNVCACDVNYQALDKLFCEPVLGGFCSEQSPCHSDSFHCSNNKCQCKRNFTAVSTSQCIETNLLNSCGDVTECSDSWHAQCSLDGKCVCALNNIAFGISTCLPLLNGYCWRDNQCMADNSICTDFRCACKPNFIAVANNLCVPDTRRQFH